MEQTTLILFIAAFIPAVFYVLYIEMVDSHKPEPRTMLIAAVAIGVLAALAITKLKLPMVPEGVPIREAHSLTESFSIGFLGLAIPAEVAKWLALFIFLSLNKFYDEYLDGMVYSVCLAMGFAGIWSVWFMTDCIDSTSFEMTEKCIFIILILVPIHLAAGSMMGYFFALAKGIHKIKNYVMALLVPILISGSLCSLFFMLGGHESYYVIVGILFTVLSMLFFTMLFRLLKKDGIKYK